MAIATLRERALFPSSLQTTYTFRPVREFVLLAVLFLLSEWIIRPMGDFPINDDFAYAKSVETLVHTGKFDLGYWPAMTLIAQTYWGALFVKLFGFSFNVLRLSNLCFYFLSLCAFHRLAFSVSGHLRTARVMTVLLLLNPIYLWTANTFMTEVPFTGACCIALLYYEKWFREQRIKDFILSTVFCLFALFVRQLGIILPLAFVGIALLCSIRERRHLYVYGFIQLGICLLLLFIYETHLLANLPDYGSYTGIFKQKPKKTESTFSALTYVGLYRLGNFTLYSGLFLLPFSISLWPSTLKNFRFRFYHCLVLVVSGIALFCCWMSWETYPVGNVLHTLSTGTVNLGDQVMQGLNYSHFESAGMQTVIQWLSLIGVMSLIVGCFFYQPSKEDNRNPFRLFVLGVLAMYVLLMVYSDSHFDRYVLPFMVFVMLLLGPLTTIQTVQWRRILAVSILVILFLFSTFSIRDFFSWNRTRWQAIHDLKNEYKIPDSDIHGGLEHLAWEHYNEAWFAQFVAVDKPYIIAFEPIKRYERWRAYSFQKLLPFEKDTMFVLRLKEDVNSFSIAP